MNRIQGTIREMISEEGISLVTVEASGALFAAVVIDTPETAAYLKTGNEVWLVFKETEMALGKQLAGGLSIRNRFEATITGIAGGKVLTKVSLDYRGTTLDSVITTASAERLKLQVGDPVEGLVKTTEMSLMQTDP